VHSLLRAFALTSAVLCASSAFAADHAKVTIAFNFETRGVSYPAGTYVATLDMNQSLLTLRNVQEPEESVQWLVSPADDKTIPVPLIMKFDDFEGTHLLRTVQFGPRITSRLDAPAKRHDAGSFVTAVGGQ
jgi:hypothetical protein